MRDIAAACFCFLALTGCQREKREMRPAPGRVAVFSDAARQSELQPGGKQSEPAAGNPYQGNAYSISEGQRLYSTGITAQDATQMAEARLVRR